MLAAMPPNYKIRPWSMSPENCACSLHMRAPYPLAVLILMGYNKNRKSPVQDAKVHANILDITCLLTVADW